MSSIKALAIAKATGGSGGGGEITLETLNVDANATYNAPSGKAYNKVNVNVAPALETLTAVANGTYTPSTGKDGFSSVTVNIPDGDGVSY